MIPQYLLHMNDIIKITGLLYILCSLQALRRSNIKLLYFSHLPLRPSVYLVVLLACFSNNCLSKLLPSIKKYVLQPAGLHIKKTKHRIDTEGERLIWETQRFQKKILPFPLSVSASAQILLTLLMRIPSLKSDLPCLTLIVSRRSTHSFKQPPGGGQNGFHLGIKTM